jgi:hypothetical protein
VNREEIIAKIRSMIALRDRTDFEGEAQAASELIDRLCAKYNIDMSEEDRVAVFEEAFAMGRTRAYDKLLLLAVATYYDAKVFTQGASLRLVGTEAQQIQTRAYYEFIKECMENSARCAYEGEKVLALIQDRRVPGRDYLHTFKVSFASRVNSRLKEMKKAEGRVHEHAQDTANFYADSYGPMRTRSIGSVRANGGVEAGQSAGDSTSLRRQLH